MNFKVLFLLSMISFVMNDNNFNIIEEYGCSDLFTGEKSNEFILVDTKTLDQSYTFQEASSAMVDGQLISIIVKSKGAQLRIEVTSGSEETQIFSQYSDDNLKFIDLREHFLLVENADTNDVKISYKLYRVSSNANEFYINYLDIDSQKLADNTSITAYDAKEIVYIDVNTIYIDFSSSQELFILKISFISQQSLLQVDSQQALDLSGQYKMGSHRIFFGDQNIGLMTKASGSSFVNQDPGNYLLVKYDSYGFIQIASPWVFFYSTSSDLTALSGILINSITLDVYPQKQDGLDCSTSLAPIKHFTDNLIGIVIVTSLDVHIYHVIQDVKMLINLSDLNLITSQKNQILNDFNSVIAISFDIGVLYLLEENQITIYPISTVYNQIGITKSQVSLSNSVADLLASDNSVDILLRLRCMCLAKALVRFNCFSSTLKCIATISNKEEQCTIHPQYPLNPLP